MQLFQEGAKTGSAENIYLEKKSKVLSKKNSVCECLGMWKDQGLETGKESRMTK